MNYRSNITKYMPFVILILVLTMATGYAVINSVTFDLSGESHAKSQDGVFIMNVEHINKNNSNLSEDIEVNYADGTLLNSKVTLEPDDEFSEVVMKVTFYNSSDYDHIFKDIIYDKTLIEEFPNIYSNANITYSFNNKDTIIEKNGGTLEVIVNFKYSNDDYSSNILNSLLNFKFNGIYKVTFDKNGGELGTTSKEIINEETYGRLSQPTRSGYIFDGWYTSKTGGDLITSDTIVNLDSNQTLFAHWICNMIAAEATWYNRGNTPRNNITEIAFVQDYIPTTYTDSWNIDADNSGSLKAYVINGEKLVIDVAVEDIVYANPDSSYMFSGHTSYDEIDRYFTSLTKIIGLELLDTSLSTTMYKMFYFCSSLEEIDLSNFKTSKVTNMAEMFHTNSSLIELDLSSFKTGSVTNMAHMFFDTKKITNINLSSFDTSKVKNMSGMFGGVESYTELDISNFDFSSVTTLREMFYATLSLKNIQFPVNTSVNNLTTTERMFYNSKQLESIDLSFLKNTSSLTNMKNMFHNNINLKNIKFSEDFDTSKVTDMGSMFARCSNLEILDISMFDTRNVNNFSYISTEVNPTYPIRGMFTGNKKLKTIYVSDKFVTTNAVSGDLGTTNMFLDCNSLVGGNGTIYNVDNIDGTYARIDGNNNLPGYFTLKQ